MGLWNAAGKALRKILGGAGDVVKHAAPLAMIIPGVGPWGAAAIGALGGAAGTLNDKEGTNLGRALKNAVGYGATSAAGAHLGGGAIKDLGRSVGGKLGLYGGGEVMPSLAAPIRSAGNSVISEAGGSLDPMLTSGVAAKALPAAGKSSASSGGALAGLLGGDTMTKAYLGSQVVSGLGNVYGAHQMGKIEDERMRAQEEEEERRRRDEEYRARLVAPVLQQLLQRIQAGQSGGYLG